MLEEEKAKQVQLLEEEKAKQVQLPEEEKAKQEISENTTVTPTEVEITKAAEPTPSPGSVLV